MDIHTVHSLAHTLTQHVKELFFCSSLAAAADRPSASASAAVALQCATGANADAAAQRIARVSASFSVVVVVVVVVVVARARIYSRTAPRRRARPSIGLRWIDFVSRARGRREERFLSSRERLRAGASAQSSGAGGARPGAGLGCREDARAADGARARRCRTRWKRVIPRHRRIWS